MIVDRVQDIFSKIQKDLFLEFNQSIPNTRSRCFNFSFSVESHFNLYCLQGSGEKNGKKLRCRIVLETIIRFKI